MTQAFELRRPEHAIGEFSGSVALFQPVSPALFGRIALELEALAREMRLPRRIPDFGDPNVSKIAGYQRYSEDGEVAVSIVCDSQSVTFSRRDYTRWHTVKPEMVSAFERLISLYVTEVPAISSIKVQYLNEFLAKSEETTSAAEIFRPYSKWLAPFYSQQDGFWHCLTGAYLPQSGDRRMLVNINCEVAEINQFPEAAKLYVKALIMAGSFYNIPGKRPLNVSSEKLVELLSENFEESHDLEKAVLAELISVEYLDKMGAADA